MTLLQDDPARSFHNYCSPRHLGAASVAIAILSALIPAGIQGQHAADSSYVESDYSYINFLGAIAPWRLASFSLGRITPEGSVIGRLNYADRFATSGTQIEADAYPRLSRRVYGYLNFGYSHASIFPKWRLGGELFTSLPDNWEASAGFRQLRFTGSPVTLYTGAVGKYIGNYWLSLRPFFRFAENGNSVSGGLTARRYFADGEHYEGARIGYGSTPSDQISPDQLARTNSFAADVDGSGGPWQNVVGTWLLGYDREAFGRTQIRKSWTGTAGLKFFF